MSEEYVQCVCCREEIRKGAIKCIKCDTYQKGLRKYFSVSNIFLSLMIALISVTTTLFQVVISHAPKSIKIRATVVKKDEQFLQVAIINTGNTVAILRGGTLKVKRNDKEEEPTYDLRLFSINDKQVDPMIEPNKGKIIELRPFLVEATMPVPRRLKADKTCGYKVELEFVGFDEKNEPYSFETKGCLGSNQ